MDWMEIKSNEAECKLIYSNTVLISDIGNPAKSSLFNVYKILVIRYANKSESYKVI